MMKPLKLYLKHYFWNTQNRENIPEIPNLEFESASFLKNMFAFQPNKLDIRVPGGQGVGLQGSRGSLGRLLRSQGVKG